MWVAIKAVFWTIVVCIFLLLGPIIGAIMLAGTIFYVVYEVTRQYDDIKNNRDEED